MHSICLVNMLLRKGTKTRINPETKHILNKKNIIKQIGKYLVGMSDGV